MGRTIGIDLGTTYSCVGVFQNEKVEIIANENGNRTTPSCVAFTDTELLLGDAAKNQAAANPQNTVFAVKRLIGRKFDDPAVQSDMKYWPFKVICVDGKLKIEVKYKLETKSFTPEEISSMILTKMKQVAEAYLGEKVSSAVITVPAYFNDSHRQATKAAALMAGLNPLRILSEPEAAAIAYGLDRQNIYYQVILVFDLGGGTFNVSILKQTSGVFEVKSTSGDIHLGGEDFDNRMITHFINEFKSTYGKDLQNDKRALRRLRTACESAKLTLSLSSEAAIEIDFLHESIDFYSTITRTCFEELNADLFHLTIKFVEKALKNAKMDKSQIHEIILVGGSTRIPKLQKLLQDFFNGKRLNKSINPDQAVAYGAAIQAAIITQDRSEVLKNMVLGVCIPFSLGIETDDGVMTVVLKRNWIIPNKETVTLPVTRFPKKQSEINIKIYEGEHPMTKDNWLLGSFQLSIISLKFGGAPEIDITFDIDANSNLQVTATEHNTENKNKITIRGKEILSEAEAEICKKDQFQRDRIQARKSLESFCLNMKARLNDKNLGDKIDGHIKKNTLYAIEFRLKWLETNQHAEKEDFENKLQIMKQIFTPIMIKLYPSETGAGEVSEKCAATTLGASPFYNACRDNNIDLVKYHLEIMSMEEINQVEPNGSTALHISAYQGHEEIVELLLQKGACCSIINRCNCTPFDEAKTDKIKQMIRRRTSKTRFVSDAVEWIISTNDADFQAHQYFKRLETYGKDSRFDQLIYYIKQNYLEKDMQHVHGINKIKRYFDMAIDKKDPVYLLTAYTAETGFYSTLNVQLAKLRLEKLTAKENLSLAYYIGIIARHPQFETLSYTGSTFRSVMITDNDIKQYKIGTRILTKTFSSTSKQLNIALGFLRNKSDTDDRLSTLCIYEIRNQRTALDITHISLFSYEGEVLILPCTAFKIMDIQINKGGSPEVEIKLKECDPW